MQSNLSNGQLDEIREQLQNSLSQAKRDKLHTEYGMAFEHMDSRLSPDEENQWLDYLLEFEKQFEESRSITVRERIGNPYIQPLSELPFYMVGEAVTDLLNLLGDHNIAVDFLGEVDDLQAYRYLTEELLDEEMDDIRIEGMITHFTYSTPENDVEMWVENFVMDVFTQDRDYFLPGLEKQPLFNMQGEPIAAAVVQHKIEALWKWMPPTNKYEIRPIVTKVEGDVAEVWATIFWNDTLQNFKGQVESYFRLQPSPYTGWDVVQTSFLDDLLA